MPNPTVSDVHVDVPLTNISVAYIQNAKSFVAPQVFPVVPVEQQSNKYMKLTRAAFNRSSMKPRAPSTESQGGGFDVDWSNSYAAEVYSIHKDIDDRVRANQTNPFNVDKHAAEYLALQALLQMEIQWAAQYFTTSVWTTDWAGVSSGPTGSQILQWNSSSSTPIEDIQALCTLVHLASGGFRPNTLTLGRQVFDKLLNHPEFIDRLKAGQTPGGPAMANQFIMAQVFGLDRVLVMDAVQNTTVEGATESNAFIGGKHALLTYSPPTPSLETPSAGYTFAWSGYLGMSLGTRIKSFRMENISSDRVEIESAYDMKVVGADLGAFISAAVA